MHAKRISDLHGAILTHDGPQSVTGFDYEAIDFNLGLSEPGDDVAMSDVSSAFVRILQWICSGKDMAAKGARACALQYFLKPTESEYGSLEAIGQKAGVTKAALSAALMDLRKAIGLGLTLGKRTYSSETYSKAQKAAFRAGVHSSFNRRDMNIKRRSRQSAGQCTDKVEPPTTNKRTHKRFAELC